MYVCAPFDKACARPHTQHTYILIHFIIYVHTSMYICTYVHMYVLYLILLLCILLVEVLSAHVLGQQGHWTVHLHAVMYSSTGVPQHDPPPSRMYSERKVWQR